MKVEYDGKRVTVGAGPGHRQAALDMIAACVRETQKTRRLLIITAAGLFVVAAFLVVLAPQESKGLAWCIGAALVALAFGAAGYSRFYLKVPFLEVDAGEEEGSQKDSG